MKIIDLLNKIAKGEIPKRIKYKEIIYEYKKTKIGTGYVNTDEENWYKWFSDEYMLDSKEDLNNEVEILEDEEIKEITQTSTIDYSKNKKEMITAYGLIHICENKINEIIRVVNKMQKENKTKGA